MTTRRIRTSLGIFEFADEGAGASDRAARVTSPAPIALLHGFTGSKDGLRALREELRASSRVMSFDLPWHGGTTVTVPENDVSVTRCAAALVEALDDLGVERFALMGYSMGGRVALALAVNYPGRVAKLLLESASAGLASEPERAARRAADDELAAFAEREGIEAFVRRWEALPLFASLARLPEHARAELRRARLSCSASGLAASLRAMGLGAQPCFESELGRLSAPTLVVAGALDAKFSAIGLKLARAIAGARLEIIDGAGHVPHLERPRRFNRLAADFFAA
jgi:2-succinyl-6-hydroxy-2,4-cyclohexadiene-1-carboxylate synthase